MVANRAIAIASVVVICGTLATGCGGGSGFNLVKGANVVTETVNGEARVRLDVVLNTKSIRLPSFSVPIVNPKKPGNKSYGTLSLRPNAGGGGIITVDVNLTAATNDKVLDGRLPNGSLIPIGVGGAEVLGFQVRGSGSKVYVALANGIAMIGTAITIKEIDRLGSIVGGANLFPQFSSNKIRGVAGIFTSSTAGQSGIGVFADFGALLKQTKTNGVLMAQMSGLSSYDAAPSMLTQAAQVSRMSVVSKKPSRSKEKKMNRWLYRLNKDHKRKRGRARLTLAKKPSVQSFSRSVWGGSSRYLGRYSRYRSYGSRYGYSRRHHSHRSRYGYYSRYR